MKALSMIKKFHTLPIKLQVLTAVLAAPILSSLVLLGVYYGSMKEFYAEKVETYQKTTLNTAASAVLDLILQSEAVSGQVLAMAVFQSSFEGFTDKTAIEKLQITRDITSQLSNIRISNDVIDNIYLLDFDGNGFTTNSEWNKRAFTDSLPKKLQPDQRGKRLVLPPRPAVYRYMHNTASAPLTISFVTYLNKYTKSGAIGLVQIDVSYEKLKKAMEYAPSTEHDFYMIVDQNGTLMYAPDQELAGKPAAGSIYGGYDLGELSGDGERTDQSVKIRTQTINNCGWRLIQVNSDNMLKEELQKAKEAWVLIFLLCLGCALALSYSISVNVTRPVTNLIKSMGKAGDGNLNIQAVRPDNQELAELTDSFNNMMVEIDHLMKENIQKEHEKTTMQMMALNAKINSHFLYNTLNTIKWQAIKNKQNGIAESIVSLTKILEYSYKDTGAMVTLQEEFRFIQDYIYIQNIRYESSVTLVYDMQEDTMQGLIYKMLLQPIVENALMHAFSPEDGDSRITITCSRRGGYILIQVRDNGKGFLFGGMDRLTGIGLNNVLERMKLNYKEDCHMEINSAEGEGTVVELKIPYIREQG